MLIYTLLTYFVIGASIMYLLVCVDPHSKGILSILRRFVFDTFPAFMKKFIGKYLGRKFVTYIERFSNYICFSNHPLIQIFYLVVVIGGYALYFKYNMMDQMPNKYVSDIHQYTGTIMFFACLLSFYLACKVGPGEITKQNQDFYTKKYPCDNILFEEGKKCETCKTKKPGRSKHCRVCNYCIPKFDHHCVWVKQCIGEKNYKFFLLFIFMHMLLTFYGSIVAIFNIKSLIDKKQLLNVDYKVHATGEIIKPTLFIVFRYLLHFFMPLIFTCILCIVMGITLGIFLLYHLWMVKGGLTTNERIRKSDYIDYYKKCINHYKAQIKSIEADVYKLHDNIYARKPTPNDASNPQTNNSQNSQQEQIQQQNSKQNQREEELTPEFIKSLNIKIISDFQEKVETNKRNLQSLKTYTDKSEGFIKNLKTIIFA